MATPKTIRCSARSPATFLGHDIQQESADAASSVLQKNHDGHDFIYTDWGAHNHIVHHISTIFALGANPSQIGARYDRDASDQRAPPPLDPDILPVLHDRGVLLRLLSTKTKLYTTFLRFFTAEIEQKGVQGFVHEYVFSHDKLGDTLFMRLSSAFCHPIIHLGFGIEFDQPALVAEALAQTACHSGWDDGLWLGTKEYLQIHKSPKSSMIDIISHVKTDSILSTAARWEEGQKIRDGVVGRAKDRLVTQTSKWQIDAEDDLYEVTAQMISTFAHYTVCVLRKDKQINFDFYFMHMVNSSIFFTTFLQQNWIDQTDKAVLLTSHCRYGIAIYAPRRSPTLYKSEVVQYQPKKPGDWQSLSTRACVYEDGGYASKLVRALANGGKLCQPYNGRASFPMEKPMWLQSAHMVMDAVEVPGHLWLRSVGLDEVWNDVPPRSQEIGVTYHLTL